MRISIASGFALVETLENCKPRFLVYARARPVYPTIYQNTRSPPSKRNLIPFTMESGFGRSARRAYPHVKRTRSEQIRRSEL